MKWLILLAGIGLGLGALFLSQRETKAWTQYYPRVATNVTYSCGNAELAQAIQLAASVSGVRDGGCTNSNPIIKFVVLDPWPTTYPYNTGNGLCWRYNDTFRRIEVRSEYAHAFTEIAHEAFHCLGLGHSEDETALMYWNPCHKPEPSILPGTDCNTVSADDIAGLQTLYGPPPIQPTNTPILPTNTPTPTPTQQVCD